MFEVMKREKKEHKQLMTYKYGSDREASNLYTIFWLDFTYVIGTESGKVRCHDQELDSSFDSIESRGLAVME